MGQQASRGTSRASGTKQGPKAKRTAPAAPASSGRGGITGPGARRSRSGAVLAAGENGGGYLYIDGMGRGCSVPAFNGVTAMRFFRSWAYAAAILNANAVANVPLRLYSRKPRREQTQKRQFDVRYRSFKEFSEEQKLHLSGKGSPLSRSVQRKVAEFGEDLVEVTERHDALAVLDRPNRWQNGYELAVLQMLDLQILGDSYLHPIMGSLTQTPAEAVRLPPHHVEIVEGEDVFIQKYKYGAGESAQEFGPDEIVHLKYPNPDCTYHGRPWFRAAWDALALHDAKRQMDLAVFQNMARPDYLLSTKQGVDPKTLDKVEDKINTRNTGPRKAGRFLTLPYDVSVTQLNWKFEEIGTGTRVIEEVSAASGVPVAMLLSNDPTKASSVAARTGWYRNTVRPYCRLHEEALNQWWLPYFEGDDEMFLCYDPVSFEDAEALSKRIVGEVAGGVRRVNEGRVALGLPELPGYDIIYPPSGATGAGAALLGDAAVGQGSGGDPAKKEEDA